MKAIAVLISAGVSLTLVASCARHHSAGANAEAKADFVVIFDGPAKTCAISGLADMAPHTMVCEKVAPYLVNTLKLPAGSLFDIKTIPDVNVSEHDQVMSALKAAGYKLAPGVHVGFLTEPKPRDH